MEPTKSAAARSVIEAVTLTAELPSSGKPPSAADPLDGESVKPPATRPARVLVVDDHVDTADMVAAYLEGLGHEVRHAYSADAALEMVESFVPMVALIDVGLPLMDGYELARRLQDMPGMRDLHLVAVSGYGREEDRLRAREAGFEVHLVKPVELHVLAKAVARLSTD